MALSLGTYSMNARRFKTRNSSFRPRMKCDKINEELDHLSVIHFKKRNWLQKKELAEIFKATCFSIRQI